MKSTFFKTFKIISLSILTLIVLCIAVVSFLMYIVFTPAKLTPIVTDAANNSLNADLSIESVELTFFSTFPRFSLKVNNGTLVSKAINDSIWNKKDSLVSFEECLISVNPIAFLNDNDIDIHTILLKDASVYAFKNKEGMNNWDIVLPSTDSIDTESDTTQWKLDGSINVRNIELRNANIVFDDRDTRIYTRLDSANLKLKFFKGKENTSLSLYFDNKNVIFWQEGELLVNKIATSLKTDIDIDHPTQTFSLANTELTVNGVKLEAQGTFVRDTVAKTVDVDVEYGLHTPSVKTVLEMIPESVMKKTDVTAQGEVTVKGTLKGLYGEKQVPVATLKIQIRDASAKYVGFKYGVDHLSTDFEAYLDLMRQKPSYLNLKIFRFKGANTDVLASAHVEDLLTDPLINFSTTSTVDLDALAKTFPLQEGVTIKGKLDADLKMRARLSALKQQDLAGIKANGTVNLNNFSLIDKAHNFDFNSSASLVFSGDNTLQANLDIKQLTLQSEPLTSSIENLSAQVTSSSNIQDTTQIPAIECTVALHKLKANMGDTLKIYSGSTTATVSMKPRKRNVKNPSINLKLRTDSLFFRLNDTKMGMDLAGFDVQLNKANDSVWWPKGTVGFQKLFFVTPDFGLPVRMSKTKITLNKGDLVLHNAALKLGNSDMVASGTIYKLVQSIRKKEMLRAKLEIKSDRIDCNQLINALAVSDEQSTNTTSDDLNEFTDQAAETVSDTLSSDFKLFVIPENIEFDLYTNVKKVTYDKMLFENVVGQVEIRNQAVYLKELSMRALDAQMKTTMIYKANESNGYVGFDFKISDINIGKLVEFIPSLDTIVPMLRSFKGVVDFDIVAESNLDSALNIQIPTLKSAINIKGSDLVLLDGETFAEISKILMFKNKKENVFDSIAANITINNGSVTIYPFLVEIDRYRVAVGGQQNLDLSFAYHVSVLKSPVPFKLGVNITGTLDNMKIRIGEAKYKNLITPVEIMKVDSTRVNMGNVITDRFRKVINQ